MDYFFVSRAKVHKHFESPTDVAVDGRRIVNAKAALPDSTPFFTDDQMRPLEPWCSFFFKLAKKDRKRSANTLRSYAYDLLALEQFLSNLDPPVDVLSADEDDLLSYRDYRTEYQDKPVSKTTWNRNRVPIKLFYEWAVDKGLIERLPYSITGQGKDPLYLPINMGLDVRHLTHAQWRVFHRVGLGGYLPDGDLDPQFHGQDTLRNMAAAELAVTTGLRLREFSALLDIEVGPPRDDRSAASVELQAIAKGGYHRTVNVQHDVLRSIDAYRRTERAIMARHAARALARRRDELFVVTDVDAAQMRLRGRLRGQAKEYAISAMPADIRRNTVIEGDHGLEPMGLFLGRGGRMLGKARWEQIFESASKRAARVAAETDKVTMPRKITPHDMRHTFAVYMLKILTEHQIEEAARRRAEGAHEAYIQEHIGVNPLLRVQELLGHQSPSSTLKYLRYIEDTNVIVARAVAEWTDSDRTYVDYADQIIGREAS
jgi:site-specific recombinase XerD